MMETFEHLVVGKGMIGAAALRYLSCGSRRVGAIGPDEPVDTDAHDGVFSSHYDQGRICTQLSRDRLWGALTRQSMSCYDALEAAGATQFYRPVGMLHIAPAASVRAVAALAHATAVDHTCPSRQDLAALWASIVLPAGHRALLETAPAGILDPRALIRSQLCVAMRQGGRVIRETAVGAEPIPGGWKLTTDRARQVTTKNLLICAGAYSNCFGFFRRSMALRVKSETTILVRVADADAQRLSSMPAIGYQIDAPGIADVYLTPPLMYPDKNIYIKLGANTDEDVTLETLDDIQHWMKHGCRTPRPDMVQALRDILPGLDVKTVKVKRCLVTYSEHGKPYIDAVGDGLFVATAGNGSGAACSDTLGALAADLMLERPWVAPFGRADFGVRWTHDTPSDQLTRPCTQR